MHLQTRLFHEKNCSERAGPGGRNRTAGIRKDTDATSKMDSRGSSRRQFNNTMSVPKILLVIS